MSGESLASAQTATFTFMTIAQLAHIFNVRRQKGFGLDRSLFKNKVLILALCFNLIIQAMAIYLSFFNDILGTQALRANTLLILLLASLAITALVYLITKVIRKTAA